MQLTAVDTLPDLTDATLVIGVIEGPEPAPGSEEEYGLIDAAVIDASGFEGKAGESLVVPFEGARAALLVGLGSEVTFEKVRSASGSAVKAVKTDRLVTLLSAVGLEQSTRAVAEGSVLGGYSFRAYKTKEDESRPQTVEMVGADPAQVAEAVIASEMTNRARDWVNTPAMDLSPAVFADQIAALAVDAELGVEVWDRQRIEEEELGAVLGVAAGSDREPRVVTLTYRPEGASTHMGLVGKGITFDTGGLSIKSASFMEDMKDDMAGAAAAVSATVAIARLGLPIAVTCVVPITDNAIGGNATRPGDVLRPAGGPTIEVLNTDAEGRLVLADGLILVRRHEPDFILDVATLTGAARIALGDKIGAVFSSDPELAKSVLAASTRAGESFWEMPLHGEYRKSIDSNVADIKNVSGSRYGGAIAAALFLSEYAGDGPWAHLDIAGPAMSRENSGENSKGASGVGVRTLIEIAIAASSS